MICGYNNIYDLCINKYTYQYINASGSINDPVLRIDKIDDSRSYISPINTDVIVPCDYNDETEAVSSWDCYQIYKNFSLSISNNTLEQQKNNQTTTVSNFNNSTLNAGIDIHISNNSIITLKTTKEDQIHIGNIVAYANLAYEQNTNSMMPPILDINSNAYNLNYQQLFKVCSEYLNTIILYHYINKDLDNSLSNSTTSDEIANCNYCDSKQPKSFDVPTIPLNDLVDNDKNLDINLEIQRCFGDNDCPPGAQCVNGVCSYSSTTPIVEPFTPMAVLLTSETSYTVPAGATSMKVWAIGGGGGSNGASSLAGGAGGCSYRTFSVTGGSSVTYSIGSAGNNTPTSGGNTTATYGGVTITGLGGQFSGSGPNSGSGGTFSGGDGGSNGGAGVIDGSYSNFNGGAVGGNAAATIACNRRPASDVSGLFAALTLAGSSTTATCTSATVAAFGAGAGVGKYVLSHNAGLGGGSVNFQGYGYGLAGAGAVVIYFT